MYLKDEYDSSSFLSQDWQTTLRIRKEYILIQANQSVSQTNSQSIIETVS